MAEAARQNQTNAHRHSIGCPVDKVRNPKTRRCVGAVRWCQANDGLDAARWGAEVAGRCRSSLLGAMAQVGPVRPKPSAMRTAIQQLRFEQAVATALPCPGGMVRSPATGRCVKRTTKGGGGGRNRRVDWSGAGLPGRKKKTTKRAPKPCAAGKVRNPATGRCVKVGGGRSTNNLRVNWSGAGLPRLTRRGATRK